MANFDKVEIGSILKLMDASFLKDPSLVTKYQGTYTVVLAKDAEKNTILVRLFDGNKKWVKSIRVADSFEVME